MLGQHVTAPEGPSFLHDYNLLKSSVQKHLPISSSYSFDFPTYSDQLFKLLIADSKTTQIILWNSVLYTAYYSPFSCGFVTTKGSKISFLLEVIWPQEEIQIFWHENCKWFPFQLIVKLSYWRALCSSHNTALHILCKFPKKCILNAHYVRCNSERYASGIHNWP